MIFWHRIFGAALMDFFSGTCWEVELEKDLSKKLQLLDAAIVRKTGSGYNAEELPDGFEDLTDHNIITYKSMCEPLDTWALIELAGHYANYRKLASSSGDNLEPQYKFNLYAVCTRFPEKLAKTVKLDKIKTSVYKAMCVDKPIKIIILSKADTKKNNALWNPIQRST